MAFASLSVDLTAKIAQFEETMGRATKGVDKLNSRAASLANGFKAAFGAAAVGGLVALAKSGIDAADAIGKLSVKTGVGVKELAGYRLAAESADTSLEEVGKAMQRLRVSIGDAELGNVQLQESLQRLGVTTKDPKAAFEQLADAVKNSNDPSRTAADLAKVLGKSYANLLPLLSGGGQALRDSAAASESFADAMARLAPDAEKFNDQLTELKINAAGAAASVLTKMVPALNEAFERIVLIKDLIDKGGLFNTIVSTAGTSDIAEVMRRVRSEIELTQQAIEGKLSLGANSSAFEEKLRGLNAQLQVLIENRAKAILEPPKSASSNGIKSDVADTAIGLDDQADKIQAALKKAFGITPMDKFLEQFKDRRKKITDEYARLKADLAGPALDNVKGFDIQAELRKGQGALASGDSTGVDIARDRLKEMLASFSTSEGAASFEKSFFTEQIKAFELSIVDAEEKITVAAQDATNKKIGALSKDLDKLSLKIDGDALVSQVKDAVAQIKTELARDPLKIPIIGVPSVSSDGRQSVDIGKAALQYGGRR